MAIFFHGSFGLKRHYMAGVLKNALENPSLSDAELAAPFGYKAPFAAKYRTWLHKTGIAELRLPLKLTSMGDVVWNHDPTFEQEITLWFMHHELTQYPDRAEAWHFFFHECLPANLEFTRDQLTMAIMEKFRSHSEKHFGPNSKMNPVIVRKLIECYTDDAALGRLGLINQIEPTIYRFDVSQKTRFGTLTSDKDLLEYFK